MAPQASVDLLVCGGQRLRRLAGFVLQDGK